MEMRSDTICSWHNKAPNDLLRSHFDQRTGRAVRRTVVEGDTIALGSAILNA